MAIGKIFSAITIFTTLVLTSCATSYGDDQESRISDLECAIDFLDGKISDLESKVDELEDKVDYLEMENLYR